VCVDVGSTFTKAVLVDLADGALLATAAHPTTLPGLAGHTDVLDGVAAVRDAVFADAGMAPRTVRAAELLLCSSAGGGLRLAVVGYERVVTAEAGHRVALSAGGKVVHVASGMLDAEGVAALRASRPDIVLLVGGTDGGNADVLVRNARRIGIARLRVPVVVAGNADAATDAAAELTRRGCRVTVTANVLPRIGVLDPLPSRAAIREAFLDHVIGGKGLSTGTLDGVRFADLVRAPTPDVVLAGVEVLADGAVGSGVQGSGDVLVVDVGGATTDVYSVITPSGEDVALRKDVVAPLWRARTVEGDLGMRWGATGVVEAAGTEGLLDPADGGPAGHAELARHAEQVTASPGFLPADAAGRAVDVRLAALAVRVAARRHARATTPTGTPRPLRDVGLVVGSGGVLRHADDAARRQILGPLLTDHAGGWPVPDRARLAVDQRYVLFAAGLLSAQAPVAAARLAAALTWLS